jgi:hypothetical protein
MREIEVLLARSPSQQASIPGPRGVRIFDSTTTAFMDNNETLLLSTCSGTVRASLARPYGVLRFGDL